MSKKIASITEDKKLLLTNTIIEDDKYRLSEDGTLYIEEIIEGNSFSIGKNTIEANEFIEGYPLVKPVIDDSLVLWLDGTTGNNYEQTKTWTDLSGNGNHGSLKNFAYNRGSGWVDGGLELDGVDDYVDLGLADLRDEITLDVIIELNLTDQHYNRIFTRADDSVSLFTIGNDKTVFVKLTTSQGSSPRPKATIEHNKVVQIAFTYSTSTGLLKLYIDGKLKSEVQRDNTPMAYSEPFIIGFAKGGGSFCGKCYSCKLYSRALTDEEVMQNYKAGQCSPLLAKGEVM